MMNVALIPVRGGSKSIPLKNIKVLNGKPLVYWTIKAACECEYINKVYVATDDELIKEKVEEIKLEDSESVKKISAIGRSRETSTDEASTESVMLEFAKCYDFDNIVLIQATSPLLQKEDLDNGFKEFVQEGVDSVFSVVKQKRFNWAKDEKGFAKPLNYNVYRRPRRQDFDGYYVENGAYYITSKKRLLESENRLSGNIKMVEMPEDTFFEIDEPSDWIIVEELLKRRMKIIGGNIPKIKMLLSDCDGCLTDGGMYYSESGDEIKKFNTRDGMGFAILRQHGILTGIITGEDVELNKRRAKKLKLDIIESGCKNKLETLKRICVDYNINMSNVCYIGDDINDIDVLKEVGYGCCPANATSSVKKVVNYVAKTKGGDGVLREVVDLLHDNSII